MLFKLCHGSHFSFWVCWALCLHFPFCCTGSEEPMFAVQFRSVQVRHGRSWVEWRGADSVRVALKDHTATGRRYHRMADGQSTSVRSPTGKNVSSILTHCRGLLHCQDIVGARIRPLGRFAFPAGRWQVKGETLKTLEDGGFLIECTASFRLLNALL